jgi:tetratricopeptide (TPR) repeat protein
MTGQVPEEAAGMRALTAMDGFARTRRTANCADTAMSYCCHVHDMTNLDIIGYQEVDPGVGAVKREPTSPGPITDLFARLDDLHSRAGRPSMREIAIRAGRGNISSSTVHNIFRSSRVPKWGFLEQVVRALGGGPDRDDFLLLWQAAWRAENGEARGGPPNDTQPQITAAQRSGLTPRVVRESRTGMFGGRQDGPHRPHRIWSNEIPARNLNFTGRVAELEAMSGNLTGSQAPRVQVICGMGGIGKTELATEYVYRNIEHYEVIWWIRAEHHDRVRDALVKLAQRLELRQATTDSGRDRTITAVLEALQSGDRTNWLLVYDNAVSLLDLQRYLPACPPGGHILITSRELTWPGYIIADPIEVAPFTEDEAVSFLRQRVPGLGIPNAREQYSREEDARRAGEAGRLAAELGHLPIAIDHAAAYLAETSQTVDEYLNRFARNAHQLLSEQPGESEFPAPVSGTWAMSTTLLTPDAEHLFNLCAFFSPEPIAAELFLQDTAGIDDPPGLSEFLSSEQRFRAAASLLHRISLAKVDGARDLIQVHRVVQAVTQGQLRQNRIDGFHAYRSAADMLLARSNPGNPDQTSSDAIYDLSLQHLESDYRFLNTGNPALRGLIIGQVRRLHLRGAHAEAMQFGLDALRVWRERLGEDHLQVLTLAVEVAVAMYISGRAADAHDLILQTRPLLQRYTEGAGFRVLLFCENFYGEDLRARSQFREALDLDRSILPKYEAIFGINNERTLNVRSNIAIDYRELGQFWEALETDQLTYEGRREILGPNDPTTLYSLSAVARDQRSLGFYQESLGKARKVVSAFEAIGGPEHPHWLSACAGFSTALRKAGYYWDALQESERVLQRYREYMGVDHMYTLRAAANLVNDRRAVGDLAGAEELARETRDLCLESSRPDDLLYVTLVNLASVLRVAERADEALPYDDQGRKGLIRIYGDQHPFTLAASINYAADLAACSRLGEALQLGRETLLKCQHSPSLGDDHPDTLMAAANLAMDEAAAGDHEGAQRLLADVLSRYEQTLTLEHPAARAAAQGIRLNAEIEPNP